MITQTQQTGLRNAVKLVSQVLDGVTGQPPFNQVTGETQLDRVLGVLQDYSWHPLGEIAFRTGDTTASVSARIRDLRKLRFGNHIIDRRRLPDRQGYAYRMVS
jgi:hypothetical protein